MRGENVRSTTQVLAWVGSPPHARGKLLFAIVFVNELRITPACAGKTPWLQPDPQQSADHPRMRGENELSNSISSMEGGSPPHARGKPLLQERIMPSGRITPACAGKTSAVYCSRSGNQDHPRMRGENYFAVIPDIYSSGSPPHARGKQKRSCTPTTQARITPACAGKTDVKSQRSAVK